LAEFKSFRMPKLCIIPTPIGNLEDITLRAIRMLKESNLILAEDTRVTRVLLSHLDLHKRMISYHVNNEHAQLEETVRQIQTHEQVALVSDAGTPGISDPGFLLVRACIERGIEVECLPGPTAFVPALVVSGLPADRFFFEGFLPHKKGRQSRLEYLATLDHTVIFYESPYRLVKTLEQIAQVMGAHRKVSVSKEISKMHETHFRGTIEEAVVYFSNLVVKGEFVIVVGKANFANSEPYNS